VTLRASQIPAKVRGSEKQPGFAWAVGVIDSSCVFKCVVRRSGKKVVRAGMPLVTSTRIFIGTASIDVRMANRLTAVFGTGEMKFKTVLDKMGKSVQVLSHWEIPYTEHEAFCTLVIPFMENESRMQRASAVLQFRRTVGMVGGKSELAQRGASSETVRQLSVMIQRKRLEMAEMVVRAGASRETVQEILQEAAGE
jgi:hypothetical protein